MKRFYTSIPLVALWSLIIIIILSNRTVGQGLIIVYAIFFIISYIAVFTVFTIISIVRLIKKKEKFNFIPIIVTIVAIISILFAYAYAYEIYHAPNILRAEKHNICNSHHVKYGRIELREDSTYKIQLMMLEATGFCRGDFKTKQDTLFLEDNVIKRSDSTFFEKYLIDKKHSVLIPIINNQLSQDSSKILNLVYYF